MAVTTTETYGRWIFNLQRGDETTTRVISIPAPVDIVEQETAIQTAVDALNASISGGGGGINLFVQPANWRDNNDVEESWTTTSVNFEVVSTSRTPFE